MSFRLPTLPYFMEPYVLSVKYCRLLEGENKQEQVGAGAQGWAGRHNHVNQGTN